MSRAIAHRGPDDDGVWSTNSALFLHRRLSILDLSSAGHQPMVSACGRYIMVFNGEIYNYRELRPQLEERGAVFRGSGDSEVLLASYAEFGADCLAHLNGMWALAIWDVQRKRLFVSRDRFGKKPFYYALQGGRLIFASEIKAILASGVVAASPNPTAVGDFCAERVSDHTAETFFKEIHQLRPGTFGLWQEGQFRTSTYWTLPDDAAENEPGDPVESIRDLLADSVKLRLRSDARVGTTLSGGLDSSGVACFAAGQSTGELHAFSTIVVNPPEEAAGIVQVAHAQPNLTLHSDQPDGRCLVDELDECLWHQDEPFADGSMLAHFRLMRLARERGVKVILTGQGADEVFAGYPGHLVAHVAGLIARGAWAEARSFTAQVRATGQPISMKAAFGYAMPAPLAQFTRGRGIDGRLDWLDSETATVSSEVRAGIVEEAGRDRLNGTLRKSISKRTLPGFLHYDDRNSMAFGVETRAPYLDHRLVSKVLPTAGGVKVRRGRTKSLLRDALMPIVPRPIVSRLAKQGYPAPIAHWVRSADQAVKQEWLATVKLCPMIRFDRWSLRSRRFLAGDDRELPAVWRGLILALWYSRFVARPVCP
jgi:asparagine synthase (glutamine-hydrolysing)